MKVVRNHKNRKLALSHASTTMYSTTRTWCVLYLSLGTPSIPFFKFPKRSQRNHCPWVCFLIFFLKISLFGVVVLLLGRKAWRTLTSICIPFYSLRIFLLIPKESGKFSKITWILVFIIVLKTPYLVDLPLSPNNPCNFKENIINYGNRHVLLLQHII